MKNIFFVAILLICSFGFANAQTDYCKDIMKEMILGGKVTSYTSPIFDFICIRKEIRPSYEGTTSLEFYITKKTADYDAGGLYVAFADGTMWKDLRKGIDCSYLDADHGYRYLANRIIRGDVITMFKTKKIVKVQIMDVVIPVTDDFATKFMAYVNCIDALKQ